MTFIFEIDEVLINYSLKVTYCHFSVKQNQRMVKIGMMLNFGSENPNLTFIFEIDEVLINYSLKVTKSANGENRYDALFRVIECKFDLYF